MEKWSFIFCPQKTVVNIKSFVFSLSNLVHSTHFLLGKQKQDWLKTEKYIPLIRNPIGTARKYLRYVRLGLRGVYWLVSQQFQSDPGPVKPAARQPILGYTCYLWLIVVWGSEIWWRMHSAYSLSTTPSLKVLNFIFNFSYEKQ